MHWSVYRALSPISHLKLQIRWRAGRAMMALRWGREGPGVTTEYPEPPARRQEAQGGPGGSSRWAQAETPLRPHAEAGTLVVPWLTFPCALSSLGFLELARPGFQPLGSFSRPFPEHLFFLRPLTDPKPDLASPPPTPAPPLLLVGTPATDLPLSLPTCCQSPRAVSSPS